MASSSLQRGVARSPPPPNQLAAFYKLVDKKVVAGQLCRNARNAELSAQAAEQAETLFGDDSLVPSMKPGSVPTSRSTGCGTAPSPPVQRRRRRSKSLRGAPAVAPWCTAAWNTKRWTGGRTKRRAARRRRRCALRRRRRKEGRRVQTVGREQHDETKLAKLLRTAEVGAAVAGVLSSVHDTGENGSGGDRGCGEGGDVG